MSWLMIGLIALVLSPLFVWWASRINAEIHSASELSLLGEVAGYMALCGLWAFGCLFFHPADVFFIISLIPFALVLHARWRCYEPRKNDIPLPFWAAFAFSNWKLLLVIGLLKTFICEPMSIPSSSMRPGLIVGDQVLVSKFEYGIRMPFLNRVLIPFNQPQHGDVMVFRYPKDETTNYIKRVIGLPGDFVQYQDKQVSINGVPLARIAVAPFVYSDRPTEKIHGTVVRETMGKRVYDTYDVTTQVPLVPISVENFPDQQLCTTSVRGFTCTVPANGYLVLGDNRDNSSDSRYWGFVRSDELVGKAMMVWMNTSHRERAGLVVH